MEPGEVLAGARSGLADMGERYARLVEQLDDTRIPVRESAWTVRDAAAHLASGSRRYAGLVRGEADVSAIPLDKAYLDRRAASLIADNPETDPKTLADQIREGFQDLLHATENVAADQPISWYAGLRLTAAAIVAIYLGEPILHGYDIATAAGLPWPIDPEYAVLATGAYRLIYPGLFQPSAAAGIEATYGIRVAGSEPFTVRVANGLYDDLPASPNVDCTISAEPVSALMVISGRLSRWTAIALGELRFTGDTKLGPRFFDLFVFP